MCVCVCVCVSVFMCVHVCVHNMGCQTQYLKLEWRILDKTVALSISGIGVGGEGGCVCVSSLQFLLKTASQHSGRPTCSPPHFPKVALANVCWVEHRSLLAS